ncbi:phospho-N-acetylmuramoyl-pentapeptide-transferase [Candidatus Saccharibacteria bacterium oral taxon 488]|jgi:phospho-N-acetylmuramoyl-pentapeptide-transferase|nr:phospho-N-acetylmuramoyl-pentapeptide-transferase [Candidatus Saccharibacteria bacterium oral taxon 488]QLF51710.1 phospho-N-acetylmuramoyl-pentapeptide-transferase [Candidatus Saccharibacteria bacterium oral taxon 488]
MATALQTMTNELTHVFLLSVGAFLLAMFLTPIYTFFAYRYRFWKHQRENAVTGEKLQVFNRLHEGKIRRNIPTMAGIISVIAAGLVTLLFNLDRAQTWLPLAAFAGGAAVGLIDDYLNIFGSNKKDAGMRAPVKFALITLIGLVLGWFFYVKLGVMSFHVPFMGDVSIGWLIIPLFAFAAVATGNAVNISDGLDGLAGGLLGISFGAFGVIALLQQQVLLAGFCFTVVGVLLSYLWFNIYPARFFMGDVGSFAYGVSLGVVAMLTNSLLLLPVIGLLFVIEAGSSLIQIVSKKLFKRKIFLSAPIHHHLEASGWPETKVTMRFWVIGCVMAFIGVMLALAGGHIA